MSAPVLPAPVAARIRDGFTFTAVYQEGRALLYSGVAIQYRPALQDEYAEYVGDPRKPLAKMREWVAKHVVAWNVEGDEPGTVAPLGVESVKQLAYPVLDWMDSCVNGYAPKSEVADAKN